MNSLPPIQRQLAEYRRAFEADKENPNGLMAWRAFWWARAEGVRVPTWVMDYLDCVANDMLNLAALENAQKVNDARIVKALKLKMVGRQTPFGRDRTALRNSLIIAEVKHERTRMSAEKAYKAVADRRNLSTEAVRTVYRGRNGR